MAGELRVMSPSGWRHGEIVGVLHVLLGAHVRANKLGKIFGAETGFILRRNPDTVRAPDVAFIAAENLPATRPTEAYWPTAPDLVVEVLSPNDRRSEVLEKIEMWLTAGSQLVWLVDGSAERIEVFDAKSGASPRIETQTLDGGDVVPGFRCDVSDVFSEDL